MVVDEIYHRPPAERLGIADNREIHNLRLDGIDPHIRTVAEDMHLPHRRHRYPRGPIHVNGGAGAAYRLRYAEQTRRTRFAPVRADQQRGLQIVRAPAAARQALNALRAGAHEHRCPGFARGFKQTVVQRGPWQREAVIGKVAAGRKEGFQPAQAW